MDSKSGQSQGLIRTVTRMAYEVIEADRGQERADAIMLSSLERGNEVLYTVNINELRDKILEIVTRRKLIDDDMEVLLSLFVKGVNDIGKHELICNLMRSEIGVHGSMVPRDFGQDKIVWSDFVEKYDKFIIGAGMDLAIKGGKGTGKSDLACSFGEITIQHGGVFAANIPIRTKKDVSISDNIHHVSYLSDLLRLRLEISPEIHITIAIDEAEPVFKKILTSTVESRNIVDFFNLTRKYDISIISIWHFDDDIPDQIVEMTKTGHGFFVDKKHKTMAIVNGQGFHTMLTRIPSTQLDFISAGAGSTASFYVDLNIKELNRQTEGIFDDKKARLALLKALDDPRVYLKGYKDRARNLPKIEIKDFDVILEEILKDLSNYITSTGRSIRWRKIKKDYGISENDAKDVRDEILASKEFQEYKKSMKKPGSLTEK